MQAVISIQSHGGLLFNPLPPSVQVPGCRSAALRARITACRCSGSSAVPPGRSSRRGAVAPLCSISHRNGGVAASLENESQSGHSKEEKAVKVDPSGTADEGAEKSHESTQEASSQAGGPVAAANGSANGRPKRPILSTEALQGFNSWLTSEVDNFKGWLGTDNTAKPSTPKRSLRGLAETVATLVLAVGVAGVSYRLVNREVAQPPLKPSAAISVTVAAPATPVADRDGSAEDAALKQDAPLADATAASEAVATEPTDTQATAVPVSTSDDTVDVTEDFSDSTALSEGLEEGAQEMQQLVEMLLGAPEMEVETEDIDTTPPLAEVAAVSVVEVVVEEKPVAEVEAVAAPVSVVAQEEAADWGGKAVLLRAPEDATQTEAFRALQALGVVDAGLEPGVICTRREYARWLVSGSQLLGRDSAMRVLPAMVLEDMEVAFDDVTPEDPDFGAIQGLAEAGLLPSRLVGLDLGCPHVPARKGCSKQSRWQNFRPDDPVTREDLIMWKVALDQPWLPDPDVQALEKKYGLVDLAKVDRDALPAVAADLASGQRSIFSMALGYTRRLQPKKPVTRAQAAAALSAGDAAPVVTGELARMAAEAEAEVAVERALAEVVEVEKAELAAVSAVAEQPPPPPPPQPQQMPEEQRLLMEQVRLDLESARSELEEARAERERERSERAAVTALLGREQAAAEAERQQLLRERAGVEAQVAEVLSTRIAADAGLEEVSRLKAAIEESRKKVARMLEEAEKERKATAQGRVEVEAEKRAFTSAREWVQTEARRMQEELLRMSKELRQGRQEDTSVTISRPDKSPEAAPPVVEEASVSEVEEDAEAGGPESTGPRGVVRRGLSLAGRGVKVAAGGVKTGAKRLADMCQVGATRLAEVWPRVGPS